MSVHQSMIVRERGASLRGVAAGRIAPAPGDEAPVAAASRRLQLRRQIRSGGAAGLPDEDLLQLIVQRAMPRQDATALVHRLLATFGNLNHVIAASECRLREVPGMTGLVVDHLKVVEVAGHRMARAAVMRRVVFDHWDALLTYLRASLAHQETERFRVLYLDRKNALIADEELGRGTVDHVPVYPREVIKRALALNASALIIVHNHPSGDPTPSDADIDMTARVANAAATLDLLLHDHIIIGRGREFSFRAEALL